jgi:hypothetical protein
MRAAAVARSRASATSLPLARPAPRGSRLRQAVHDADGLRAAALADLPPALRPLAPVLVEVPSVVHTLCYFVDHLNIALTAEDLAVLIRVPRPDTALALSLLSGLGLLESREVCGLRIYRYRLTEASCEQAAALRAWHRAWLDRWRSLGALLGGTTETAAGP